MIEFLDYRRINVDTSIVVDKSRGERLTVNLNVTFPKVPCYRAYFVSIGSPYSNPVSSIPSRQCRRYGYQWRATAGCLSQRFEDTT